MEPKIMAETQNIGEMAKIMSEDIFSYFGWSKSKPDLHKIPAVFLIGK